MAKWRDVVNEVFKDIVKDWRNDGIIRAGVDIEKLADELKERLEIRKMSRQVNEMDDGKGIEWKDMQEIGFNDDLLKKAFETGMIYESRPGRFRSLT